MSTNVTSEAFLEVEQVGSNSYFGDPSDQDMFLNVEQEATQDENEEQDELGITGEPLEINDDDLFKFSESQDSIKFSEQEVEMLEEPSGHELDNSETSESSKEANPSEYYRNETEFKSGPQGHGETDNSTIANEYSQNYLTEPQLSSDPQGFEHSGDPMVEELSIEGMFYEPGTTSPRNSSCKSLHYDVNSSSLHLESVNDEMNRKAFEVDNADGPEQDSDPPNASSTTVGHNPNVAPPAEPSGSIGSAIPVNEDASVLGASENYHQTIQSTQDQDEAKMQAISTNGDQSYQAGLGGNNADTLETPDENTLTIQSGNTDRTLLLQEEPSASNSPSDGEGKMNSTESIDIPDDSQDRTHDTFDETPESTSALMIQCFFRQFSARNLFRLKFINRAIHRATEFDEVGVMRSYHWWKVFDWYNGYPCYINPTSREITWKLPDGCKAVNLDESSIKELRNKFKEQSRIRKMKQRKENIQKDRNERRLLNIARKVEIMTKSTTVKPSTKAKITTIKRTRSRFQRISNTPSSYSPTEVAKWQEIYRDALTQEEARHDAFKRNVVNYDFSIAENGGISSAKSLVGVSLGDVWDLVNSPWTTYKMMSGILVDGGLSASKVVKPLEVCSETMAPTTVGGDMGTSAQRVHHKPAAQDLSSRFSVLKPPKETLDLDEFNSKGETLLLIASSIGNEQVVRALVDFGANVSQRDGTLRKSTAMHEACSSLMGCRIEVVQSLLQGRGAQATLLMSDWHGDTPLHCCVRTGKWSVCQLILNTFPVPAATAMRLRNAKGLTPSEIAKNCEKSQVQQLLAKFLSEMK